MNRRATKAHAGEYHGVMEFLYLLFGTLRHEGMYLAYAHTTCIEAALLYWVMVAHRRCAGFEETLTSL